MTAGAITLTILVLLALAIPAAWAIIRDERAKRREWRPDGAGAWWHRPIESVALAQSVRAIELPPPAETVEVRDPRVVDGPRKRERPKHTANGKLVVS